MDTPSSINHVQGALSELVD